MTITRAALLWFRLLFASTAFARLAYDVLGACESCGLSLVQLFQCDFVFLLFIWSLPWTSSPGARATRHSTWHAAAHTHAEHLLQDVVQIYLRARSTCTALEGRHAMCVVKVSLVIV